MAVVRSAVRHGVQRPPMLGAPPFRTAERLRAVSAAPLSPEFFAACDRLGILGSRTQFARLRRWMDANRSHIFEYAFSCDPKPRGAAERLPTETEFFRWMVDTAAATEMYSVPPTGRSAAVVNTLRDAAAQNPLLAEAVARGGGDVAMNVLHAVAERVSCAMRGLPGERGVISRTELAAAERRQSLPLRPPHVVAWRRDHTPVWLAAATPGGRLKAATRAPASATQIVRGCVNVDSTPEAFWRWVVEVKRCICGKPRTRTMPQEAAVLKVLKEFRAFDLVAHYPELTFLPVRDGRVSAGRWRAELRAGKELYRRVCRALAGSRPVGGTQARRTEVKECWADVAAILGEPNPPQDYTLLTREQLMALCRRRGIATHRLSKDALKASLERYNQQAAKPAGRAAAQNYERISARELEKLCNKRDITVGSKNRVKEAMVGLLKEQDALLGGAQVPLRPLKDRTKQAEAMPFKGGMRALVRRYCRLPYYGPPPQVLTDALSEGTSHLARLRALEAGGLPCSFDQYIALCRQSGGSRYPRYRVRDGSRRMVTDYIRQLATGAAGGFTTKFFGPHEAALFAYIRALGMASNLVSVQAKKDPAWIDNVYGTLHGILRTGAPPSKAVVDAQRARLCIVLADFHKLRKRDVRLTTLLGGMPYWGTAPPGMLVVVRTAKEQRWSLRRVFAAMHSLAGSRFTFSEEQVRRIVFEGGSLTQNATRWTNWLRRTLDAMEMPHPVPLAQQIGAHGETLLAALRALGVTKAVVEAWGPAQRQLCYDALVGAVEDGEVADVAAVRKALHAPTSPGGDRPHCAGSAEALRVLYPYMGAELSRMPFVGLPDVAQLAEMVAAPVSLEAWARLDKTDLPIALEQCIPVPHKAATTEAVAGLILNAHATSQPLQALRDWLGSFTQENDGPMRRKWRGAHEAAWAAVIAQHPGKTHDDAGLLEVYAAMVKATASGVKAARGVDAPGGPAREAFSAGCRAWLGRGGDPLRAWGRRMPQAYGCTEELRDVVGRCVAFVDAEIDWVRGRPPAAVPATVKELLALAALDERGVAGSKEQVAALVGGREAEAAVEFRLWLHQFCVDTRGATALPEDELAVLYGGYAATFTAVLDAFAVEAPDALADRDLIVIYARFTAGLRAHGASSPAASTATPPPYLSRGYTAEDDRAASILSPASVAEAPRGELLRLPHLGPPLSADHGRILLDRWAGFDSRIAMLEAAGLPGTRAQLEELTRCADEGVSVSFSSGAFREWLARVGERAPVCEGVPRPLVEAVRRYGITAAMAEELPEATIADLHAAFCGLIKDAAPRRRKKRHAPLRVPTLCTSSGPVQQSASELQPPLPPTGLQGVVDDSAAFLLTLSPAHQLMLGFAGVRGDAATQADILEEMLLEAPDGEWDLATVCRST
eukprot:TRINITY_DN24617_c0_g1_i1.p1 TRINITY_DN24617_c0_g1~~TRINITY_DN24617_c0_g1_i1.p1  ORF type:complete len:1399 (+),score=264.68 TRINITY_DN24617_c0_g1_i1:87-4283(+)